MITEEGDTSLIKERLNSGFTTRKAPIHNSTPPQRILTRCFNEERFLDDDL
ncbi:hypothetical protein KBB05_04490 [Patescibacteria group bacterium]|nr:hypothetical protein [Patescibacteria group bacterium]